MGNLLIRLVVDKTPSEKKEFVTWDYYSQENCKNNKCSKPPSRYYILYYPFRKLICLSYVERNQNATHWKLVLPRALVFLSERSQSKGSQWYVRKVRSHPVPLHFREANFTRFHFNMR